MHKTSFNKIDKTAICLFCKVNKVELIDWNKRCNSCKAEQKEIDKKEQDLIIGKRLPAAIIKTDDGRDVYVDKFGREVDNPGYNLKNDPRGWKYTGKVKDKKIII